MAGPSDDLAEQMRPEPRTGQLVVVTVGTDHHQFNRLMDWVERWLAHRDEPVRCVVQHGSSRTVSGTDGFALLPPQEFRALLSTADAVVTQGGPGSIMDAREAGRLPIVVPRLHALGEVVDDHQLAFARRLAANDLIRLAESEDEFAALVDKALADPDEFRVATVEADDHGEAMVRRFADLVDELMLTGSKGESGTGAGFLRGLRRRRQP